MSLDEERITALLRLKSWLEQDLAANLVKLEELKKDCDAKREWIRHLEEILSESSFQNASALLGKKNPEAPAISQSKPGQAHGKVSIERGKGNAVSLVSTRDGEVLATVTLHRGNILITFSTHSAVAPDDPVFMQFHASALKVFQQKGGQVFIENDKGTVRSVTIMGSFDADLKDECVRGLRHVLESAT